MYDFEFLEETFVINDLAQLELGLSKTAGLAEDLHLNSVGDSIKSFVSEHMKNSNEVPGGYFTSILNVMAPAVLMRAHPLLGILYLIGDHYGFGLSDMVTKIVTALKSKIDSGEPIQPEDVSSIGKSLLGISSEAFLNLLYQIKKEARLYALEKQAKRGSFSTIEDFKNALLGSGSRASSIPTDIPFLLGNSESSVLQRIFGSLFLRPAGGRTIKWLLGGFAIWIVKTVLAGAGLLALSEGVSSMLGHPKKEIEYEHHAPPPTVPVVKPEIESQHIAPEIKKEIPLTSFPSTLVTAPTSKKLWIVPLVGDGSITDTLKIWILDLFPELSNNPSIDKILMHNQKFQEMVHLLSDPTNIGKNSLVMPPQFSSRSQVVNPIVDSIKGAL